MTEQRRLAAILVADVVGYSTKFHMSRRGGRRTRSELMPHGEWLRCA